MDDIESATEFFTEGHHVTVIYTLEGVCVLKSSWDFKDPPPIAGINPYPDSCGNKRP